METKCQCPFRDFVQMQLSKSTPPSSSFMVRNFRRQPHRIATAHEICTYQMALIRPIFLFLFQSQSWITSMLSASACLILWIIDMPNDLSP